MDMLLFKRKFLSAIRAGEKTQTIRLWKYRRMRPASGVIFPARDTFELSGSKRCKSIRLQTRTRGPTGLKQPISCAGKSPGSIRNNWPEDIGHIGLSFACCRRKNSGKSANSR